MVMGSSLKAPFQGLQNVENRPVLLCYCGTLIVLMVTVLLITLLTQV